MIDSDTWREIASDFLEKTPLRDSYLISLWANGFTVPAARRIEAEIGITRDEFNVLFVIAARGPSLAREVCHLNGRPKNSISRAVARLQRAGFLLRETKADDRRKEMLHLTAEGEAVYRRALAIYVERQNRMLGSLAPEERRQLEGLLKRALLDQPDWLEDY